MLVVLAVLPGCATDPPSGVVGVVVTGCGARTEGSGAFVDDDLVITTAHTLRGADTVVVDHGHRELAAEIVGFDPELDLAYLRVRPEGAVRPMSVSSPADPVAAGRATAWAVRDGVPVALDVEVLRRIRLRTEDIYVEGDTTRPAFELRADIEPGDSGGPVVVGGDVIGVLWARSTRSLGRAYAIDVGRGSTTIDEQRSTGSLGDVDLTRCD